MFPINLFWIYFYEIRKCMHTVQLVCFFVPYIQGLSKEYISLPLLSVWKGQWYVSACVLLLNHVRYSTIMYLVVPIHLFHPSSSSISCVFTQQKKLCASYFSPFTSSKINSMIHLYTKSLLWYLFFSIFDLKMMCARVSSLSFSVDFS